MTYNTGSKYLYMNVHISLFIIDKKWKKSKCPPNWKMDFKITVYSYQGATVLNKKEHIMEKHNTRINPRIITVSERSQTQKSMFCMIQFI